MNSYAYCALIVAGTLFAFVGLMHLLRLIYKVKVVVGRKTIPMWVSTLGFIIPMILALWMFCASKTFAAESTNIKNSLILKSSAFKDGGTIPIKYTCFGENISPPLSWQGAPKNTKSFVLIVNDPDAPSGTLDHWILYNIPANVHALSENLTESTSNVEFGKNSWDKVTYVGPCPPKGKHRYYFMFFALDTTLDSLKAPTKTQIGLAMEGHTLAKTSLMGTYKK